ncbi:Fosmidomycin resistance protein [Lunatimonas lonarensis]|uniref:Fosmidomycin resistance protein n=1 Tax=Lunatimonas lonarensis TaxID=1232681 RepID=R7ZVT9_9BACT|nr:MFS transporter [Lunatimonas lonarensis]EON78202.1 Fosmidomycin resistance protein [Lunatimonas lonarensis]
MSEAIEDKPRTAAPSAESTVYPILFTISFAHLLNDLVQSVIPAVYPLLKENYLLSLTQIGMITLTFQATASLLQPFVGYFTDKKPQPFSLAVGMGFSLLGLLVLASANSFWVILASVALVGMGSSVFHPESSRVAYLASGGRRGFAQSVFQIGGNVGSAIGPLLVALVVMPYGQGNVRWFALGALLAILALSRVGYWYRANIEKRKASVGKTFTIVKHGLSPGRVKASIAILLVLIFSKYFYMACMTSYFTFFLIEKFGVPVATSQIYLFIFLAAIAAGTYLGGPLGDKYGRKYIIWASILGSAPFTLLLPHLGLGWVIALSVVIGVVLASAFSAILVYAQELLPGRIGMISGLFFGFAFGMGGLGSALLGKLADLTDIQFVFWVCSFLPLLGLVTWMLPNLKETR